MHSLLTADCRAIYDRTTSSVTQSPAPLWRKRLVGSHNTNPRCIGLAFLASTASTTALLAKPRTPPLADSPYSVRLRQRLKWTSVSKGPVNAWQCQSSTASSRALENPSRSINCRKSEFEILLLFTISYPLLRQFDGICPWSS